MSQPVSRAGRLMAAQCENQSCDDDRLTMSQIQPLRISKGTPTSSPTKMGGAATPRPLTELSPMERRRNSPSFNQSTKLSKKPLLDSSPFDSSPFSSKFNFAPNSPHAYWQSRDSITSSPTRAGNTENRDPREDTSSPGSPAKRSSIENLKRASRVKNSSMFAREQRSEYDPASVPVVERPLAAGRPLATAAKADGQPSDAPKPAAETSKRTSSPVKLPVPAPTETMNPPASPARGQHSPGKSSLSKNSRYGHSFGPDATFTEEEASFLEHRLPPGKSLRRHAKSVTFDAAPPQINEYEMTTPDPSSVASGSREGSYESLGDEDDDEDAVSEDADASFEREASAASREDSFDAALEDTDKTPVVLPEDWRFMSPAQARDELAPPGDDPFDAVRASPAPEAVPHPADHNRLQANATPTRLSSNGSSGSSGSRRPLPPLPDLLPPQLPRSRSGSGSSLQAAGERASMASPAAATPPRPASLSKSELQGLTGTSMSLEDRLRLMMLQEEDKTQAQRAANDEQRERRMRRAAASPDRVVEKGRARDREIKIHEDAEAAPEADAIADLPDFKLPPRINRESILRKVKTHAGQDEDEYESPAPESSPVEPARAGLLHLDPDVPIPSLEDRPQPQPVVADDGVVIKPEPEEDSEQPQVDVYAIPRIYRDMGPTSGNSSFGSGVEQVSGAPVIKQEPDDDESQYSTDLLDELKPQAVHAEEADGPPTPRATTSSAIAQAKLDVKEHRMSLSQFASLLGQDDFSSSFSHYMTPSPPTDEPIKSDQGAMPAPLQQALPPRPLTPVEQTRPQTSSSTAESAEGPQTPESVIRHKVSGESMQEEETMPLPEPVPEPVATIKAPGARLKTRPSLAPADIQTMAETRRKVSGEKPPPVPSIPAQHLPRPSAIPEDDGPRLSSGSNGSAEGETRSGKQRKSSLVPLDFGVDAVDEGLSIGLDKEFDRVIEAQKVAFERFFQRSPGLSPHTPVAATAAGETNVKGGHPGPSAWHQHNLANVNVRRQKGYLMRQNTKMVVASSASHESAASDASSAGTAKAEGGGGVARAGTSTANDPRFRGTRSAGNSPVKQNATGAWTTEPWNGRARRKSIRQSAGSPMKPPVLSGAVPPLPGTESNAVAADTDPTAEADEADDGKERGRLFVKVVGVKDLDLPLPRGERSYFCLTLDNGLHCVTTAWLELGRCAPVGQEFELVVLNDLEFQLTLQTKIEPPKAATKAAAPASSTKAAKTPTKSTFSRVFTSPKKRREQELRQQEEERTAARQQAAEADAARQRGPTAWDLQHYMVGKDGSFARAYVALKEHEAAAYGRPVAVDLPAFNEWTMEEVRTVGSSRSGPRGGGGPVLQKKPPYRIGKLELQLLYVPKPAEAADDDMPKSMNACVRELQEAERTAAQVWEGHLSQQGGDCPYWRRRFFRLEGSKLTAYHESTRQPRATINLAKASKLIDDKSTLTQKEVSTRGGSRRRSAFAAEEEGYMFVEEGFRVRFANGEVIDFYADSAADKAGWMRALADVVGRESRAARSWTGLVLARERQRAARRARDMPPPPMPAPAASSPRRESHQAPAQQPAPSNAVGTKSAPGTPAASVGRPAAARKQLPEGVASGAGSPTKSSFSRPMSQQQYQGQQQPPARPSSSDKAQQPQRPSSSDKPLPPRGRNSGAGLMSRHQKTRSMLF